jgi:hypothetical protein
VVLDVDQAELALNPTRTRVWAPIGVPWELETPGDNRKQVLFGAVNSLTGQTHVAFTAHKRSADFQDFVDHDVLPAYPNAEFIFLIVDGASIYRSKSTEAWLNARPQLKLVPLPSYAPKLNLQEHIWRWFRKDVTHNHFFHTLDEAQAAAKRFFQRIAVDREGVLQCIGHAVPSLIEHRLQTIYGSH